MVKKGIPQEVLRELNITKKDKINNEFLVKPLVEKHQIKLPLPVGAL